MKPSEIADGQVITSKLQQFSIAENNNPSEPAPYVGYTEFIVLALRFLEIHNFEKYYNRGIRYTDEYFSEINIKKLMEVFTNDLDISESEIVRYIELFKETLEAAANYSTLMANTSYANDPYNDRGFFYHAGKIYASWNFNYLVEDESDGKNLLTITTAYTGMQIRLAIEKLFNTNTDDDKELLTNVDAPKISEEFKIDAEIPPTFFVEEKGNIHTYRVFRPYKLEGLDASHESFYDIVEWCLVDVQRLFKNITVIEDN